MSDTAKKAAAKRAVDDNINKDRLKLGMGTGTTMLYIIKYITDILIHNPKIQTLFVVPTSIQTKHLLILESRKVSRATNNTSALVVTDLDSYPILDVAFDGADEIDTNTLNCIKGQGACITMERLVANAAKKWCVVGDMSKRSTQLGSIHKSGIPIECVQYGVSSVIHQVLLLGGKNVKLREAAKKSGPVVTDTFGYIIDTQFTQQQLHSNNVQQLSDSINLITGVITTGLFINVAKVAYFGDSNGEVQVIQKQHNIQSKV